MNEKWIKHKSLPMDIIDPRAILFNDKLVIASQDDRLRVGQHIKSIYQYDDDTKTWIGIMAHEIDDNSMHFLELALKRNQKSTPKVPYAPRLILRPRAPSSLTAWYVGVKAMEIDGEIHVINGDKHSIWNLNDDSIRTVYQFEDDFEGVEGISAIYIPSQQMILGIGGVVIDLDCYGEKFGIWRYCLKTKEWGQLFSDEVFPCNYASCTLSANEEYVVIAGGLDRAEDSNKMFVLDIRCRDEYKLRECSIRFPMGGAQNIVRVGGGKADEVFAVEWIRKLFKSPEFKDLSIPPICIMKLIAGWCSSEMIHWIQHESRSQVYSHYAIALHDILDSCC